MDNYDLGKTGFSIMSAINSAILKLDEIAFNDGRVLVSNAGKVKDSAITASELNALSGVDSNIQTQLDAKHGDGDSVSGTLNIASATSLLLVNANSDYVINYSGGIPAVGLAYESGNHMKTLVSGRYAISFSGKYSTDKPNPVMQASVFTGSSTLSMTETYISSGAKIGASGDLRSGGSYGVLDLDANTYVTVKVKSNAAGTTIDHIRASFSMIRIGPKASV